MSAPHAELVFGGYPLQWRTAPLFLGATKHKGAVVLTVDPRVCGDSRVARGGRRKVPHFWLLRGRMGPPEAYIYAPAQSVLSLSIFPTQVTQVINWICNERDTKFFNTVQQHSDPTSMGGLPDVPDENPAIIWGAGKNVVIHWAHW